MAILLTILAGAIGALSNLFVRKSMDEGRTARGFLVFQMAGAFLFSIFLGPLRSGDYTFNLSIACFGLISGTILACMLFFLGKALEQGPPGFTFSILNAGNVMPAIVMWVLFSSTGNFNYTVWHGLGSLFVLGGLFWAGKGLTGMQDQGKWVLFSAAMFFLQVALLSLFQWRAFLLNISHIEEVVSFFTSEQVQSQWFLPFMFLGAAFLQAIIYLLTEKRRFHSKEISQGLLGGVVNSLGVFFLICSTEMASPLQNAMIFPISSVTTIVLSNFWGQKLYAEDVNWKACQFCVLGLILGTVDWKGIASALGF